MQILFVEDDQKLAKLVVHMLIEEGYSVDWVSSGEDAIYYAFQANYDLLILDWMIPSPNGIEVCQKLREKGFQGAILLLTAKDTVHDKVQGLNAGADDYLIKPFEFQELFARIRALNRRNSNPIKEEIIQRGKLTLYCTSHKLFIENQEVNLTPREFQLLELLMRNYGQVVPRDIILERIWGYDTEITNNTINAFIKLLRKKIERNGVGKLIYNIRGVGYKMEV